MQFIFGLITGASLASLSIFLLRRRKPASEQHLDQQSMVAAVIDNAVDAIITIDQHGLVTSFNQAAEKMFLYSASEVNGNNINMLMPEPDHGLHDGYLASYQRTGEAKIIGIGREVRCKRKDGTIFPADLAVSEANVGTAIQFTGILRDLSQSKELEQQLLTSTRRLNLALQANKSMVWEYNEDSQIFRFRRRSANVTSNQPDYIEESFNSCLARVHPDDRHLLADVFSTHSAMTEIKPLEYRIWDRNGQLHWVRNSMMRINEQQADNSSIAEDQHHWVGMSRDITEEIKTQGRLAMLGKILEYSRNEVYVFDAATLEFVLINRCARRNLGYTLDELLQRTPLDIKPELSAEQFEALISPLKNHQQAAVSFQTLHQRRDESTYPVDVYMIRGAAAERDVFIAIILDISDQLQQREQLQQQEKEHQLTLRRAPLGIATLDTSGNFQSLNEAGQKMFGLSETAAIGNSLMSFVHAEDQSVLRNAIESLTARKQNYSIDTYRIRHEDGRLVVVQAHSATLEGTTGKPLAIITMLLDLTEQRANEQELQEQRQKLAHVSRVGIMGEMASGLAHEVNQPLAAITTYAQATQRLLDQHNITDPDIKKALEQVAAQALRAGDVIQRMRSLIKNSAENRGYHDFNTTIRELTSLIVIDARNSDVELRYEIDSDLPKAYFDKIQIQQVILNFVRNGIDEMQSIPLAQRILTIRAQSANDEMVKVSVLDFGAGVSEAVAQEVFHPYFTTKKAGMGMGLSICKSIISSHGGKIGFNARRESVNCSGTEFWFTIPIRSRKNTNE